MKNKTVGNAEGSVPKKALSIILSLCMLFSITAGLNLTAYANEYGDFTYIIDGGVITITGYNGNAQNVTVPAKIGAKNVEYIGDGVFKDNSIIESVVISSGIKYICREAFANSTIEKITIPNTVVEIKNNAFSGCILLEKIDIPSSVEYLGSRCFSSCKSLNEITFHYGLTTISGYCFAECISLKSVTIPGSFRSDYNSSEHMFGNCISLKSVVFEKGANAISRESFAGCTALEDVYIPRTMTHIDNNFGVYDSFKGCSSLKNVYYYGSKLQWESIGYNGALDNAEIHYLIEDKPIDATCTTKGKSQGWHCGECGVIVKSQTATSINPNNHSFTLIKEKATINKNGTLACSRCGKTNAIYSIKSISISNNTYTYDGKVKKPSVTVKDSNGNKISTSNYTVTYSNNKNVGKASVKITLKGNYSGTKTLYFTIKPKNTSISSLTAGSKKFTVKLKKYTTQTTGYEIQYATNSSFKSAKSVTIKNTTTSKTISKLSGKKKYYVRVRTYKTVNGTKYYSVWSKAKTVTTKK